MSQQAIVHLQSSHGTDTEVVEASVLATDAALVDKARRQAGIPGEEFDTGEVVVE